MPRSEIVQVGDDNTEGSIHKGHFCIGGASVFGELRLAGERSVLTLRSEEPIEVPRDPDLCITGELHNLRKISLHKCLLLGNGSGGNPETRYYTATVFPHFVFLGGYHFEEGALVNDICVEFEDVSTLFYDFDAFGRVKNPLKHLERIALDQDLVRPIPVGPESQMVYFAGKRNLLNEETPLGRIQVDHCPGYGVGGPNGIRIDNQILLTLTPEPEVMFIDIFERLLRLKSFVELLIGRPQNLKLLTLTISGEGGAWPLSVYVPLLPKEERLEEEDQTPHVADVLLDPIREPDRFVSAMQKWLDTDAEMRDSRSRFQSCLFRDRYSVDRLVAAANMFDILPDHAAPGRVDLSKELEDARNEARGRFRGLPVSPERDSILGALGRMGVASLKQKAIHRAKILQSSTTYRFDDLEYVLSEAINLRNHYVHGSPLRINYGLNTGALGFLTDTLEFVFGVSDLIKCGWDFQAYMKSSSVGRHPFGNYKVNYRQGVMRLRELEG